MSPKNQRPQVEQNPKSGAEKLAAAPRDVLDQIASDIAKLQAAMKGLNDSRVRRRAILLLLKDQTGQPLVCIEAVLKGLDSIADFWLK